jgi:hypothetical protein
MTQAKAFVKNMDFDVIARDLRQQVGALKYRTLVNMAEVISQVSPVDSGYYASTHEVALRSGSYTSNQVRPEEASRVSREGSPEIPDARNKGFENMKADIDGFGLLNAAGAVRSLADPGQNNFVFRNPMEYSSIVEAEHGVYAQTKREVARLVNDAVAKRRG